MQKPELTFFCELAAEPLKKMFESRFVMDDLKALQARLSLGILDLSDERAQVVKKLNRLGVKVVAWLLLPKSEGYWFNLDNFQQAALRYDAFKAWSTQHSLEWDGIGLDIEPDINVMMDLGKKKLAMLPELFKKLMDGRRVKRAQEAYAQLVAQMHTDGYRVEAYHIPLIMDERKSRSTVLQRAAGLVDLKVDSEVLMLYSSFLRPHGYKVLWQYAKEGDSVAIGSTGGGVDLKGVIEIPPMTWDEFSRDLRLAYASEKPIHIFCLEGCVAQGFLARLITFDWDGETRKPGTFGVKSIRVALQATLWTLQRPWVILASILGTLGGIFIFNKRKK